ncbi:basic proline-rich protein [Triticum aestivum]|uniref:basic proline-rich protein n=1 Tax=Triticum aestivum TaxID=4565 RepID=UPI0008456CBD|nr:basic proline-rich protein-like [Triticum aestivum]
MTYEHGIEGLGYFHIEVPDIPAPSPSLLAVVTVKDGVASPEMIETELNHLYHCSWDWQVSMLPGGQISVVFPDAVSHGYSTRSGDITLALHKLVVDISVPVQDPLAVAVLDTTWILIGGLPDIARSERVIRNMSRILGKVVVVDEHSLRKEEEVRVKVKSLDSSRLRGTVRVFFNDQGFDFRISPEPPNHIGRPRIPDDSFLGGGSAGGGDGGHRSDRDPRHGHPSGSEDDDDGFKDSPHDQPPAPTARGGTGAGRSRAADPLPPDDDCLDASDVSLQVFPASSPRSPDRTTPGIFALSPGSTDLPDPALPALSPPPRGCPSQLETLGASGPVATPTPPMLTGVASSPVGGPVSPPPTVAVTPAPPPSPGSCPALPAPPLATPCATAMGLAVVVTTPVAGPPPPPGLRPTPGRAGRPHPR